MHAVLRLPRSALDWLIALAGLGLCGAATWWQPNPIGTSVALPAWLLAVYPVLLAAPLAWRRSAPLGSFLVIVGGVVLQAVVTADTPDGLDLMYVMGVGLYSVAAYSERRRAVVGLGVGIGAFFAYSAGNHDVRSGKAGGSSRASRVRSSATAVRAGCSSSAARLLASRSSTTSSPGCAPPAFRSSSRSRETVRPSRPPWMPRCTGSCRSHSRTCSHTPVRLESRLPFAEPDISVLGEARTGVEVLTRTRELRPDVVLMDIRMPDIDGIEATARLAAAGSPTKVLILTTFDLDEYVYRAMKAGASGFLLKDATRSRTRHAISSRPRSAAFTGETRSSRRRSPGDSSRITADVRTRPNPGHGLSAREFDVLRPVAGGRSNAEIADALFLGEATVKSHVARILANLGLRDRVQIVVHAYEAGLVQPGGVD